LLYAFMVKTTQVVLRWDRRDEITLLSGVELFLAPQSAERHDGLLLDAELVEERSAPGAPAREPVYYIFDCLMFQNRNVCAEPLHKRLGFVDARVVRPFQEFRRHVLHHGRRLPVDIRLKAMKKAYYSSQIMIEDVPRQRHANDGLIFTPVHDAYQPGTWRKLLKWKPPELNTVDFELVFNPSVPDQFVLNASDRLVATRFAIMRPTDNEWTRMASEADVCGFGRDPMGWSHKIVECSFDASRSAWRFYKFRTDKANANDVSVVNNVIRSIVDGTTLADLQAREQEIRRNWAHRESVRALREELERISGSAALSAVPSMAEGTPFAVAGLTAVVDVGGQGWRMPDPTVLVPEPSPSGASGAAAATAVAATAAAAAHVLALPADDTHSWLCHLTGAAPPTPPR
jgi:mRNA guanylyltransferase